MARFFLFVSAIHLSFLTFSQQIFSSGDFDFNKSFAPYEVSLIQPLNNNELILLSEYQKGVFKLSRLDEYFIDKWSQLIDLEKEGSFPVLLALENEVKIFRFWTQNGQGHAEIRIFDIESGELLGQEHKIIIQSGEDSDKFGIKFSPKQDKLVVYNPTNDKPTFDVYETSTLNKITSYSLPIENLSNKSISTFLHKNGNLFVALGDACSFTLDIYFFQKDINESVKLSSNFSFKRPADHFSSIEIVKQSESTYMVVTAANIEEEIVALNVSSFNVVLKSLLLSNTIDIDQSFISTAYQSSLFTSENQKKKYITTPENLNDFDIQQTFIDREGNVTIILEEQELPSTYHSKEEGLNFSLKWKDPEEIYFSSEDLILININSEGQVNWKKVIQKSQQGLGSGLTLSYLANQTNDDELELVMKESAKGNSLYYINIDLTNGNTVAKKGFLDDNMEINKNYCSWLKDKTLFICANKPGSTRRSYYFIEF